MFGFFGKAEATIDYQSHGFVLTSGNQREMSVGISRIPTLNTAIKAYVDFDADDGGGTFTVFNSISYPVATIPKGLLSPLVDSSDVRGVSPVKSVNDVYDTGINRPYARYPSSAVLSPTPRRNIVRIPADAVYGLGSATASVNGSGKLSNSSYVTGSCDFVWSQFPNLRFVHFHESTITAISKPFSSTIKYIHLRECPNLAVIPNIPPNVEYLHLSEVPAGDFITNINTRFSNASGIKHLHFYIPAPFPTTKASPTTAISGNLDLSPMVLLEQLLLTLCPSLTSLTLPASNLLINFDVSNTGITSSAFFGNVLANNANLKAYVINNNVLNWSKNFTNSDLPSSLAYFWTHFCKITGSIDFSASQPNMKDLMLGNQSSRTANSNTHNNVDLTGLTNVISIDITGCQVQNLQLPNSTTCTTLICYDNELDVTVNTSLISQLNAMTGMLSLFLSNNGNTNSAASYFGQTNLGSNVSFASLVNMTQLMVAKCNLSGTLTLPNVNKLISLQVSFNTSLTSFVNLTAHTSLQLLRANGCTSLAFSITSVFTNLSDIRVADSLLSSIDLSGKNTTSLLVAIIVDGTSITSITMPSSASFAKFTNSHAFSGTNCSSLTTINNLNLVSYNSGNQHGIFSFAGCALTELPFGTNDFIPSNIAIQNNGMDQMSVDANINNIYQNRAKWSFYIGTVPKTLNIGGSNAAPSGTYQAPSGFVLGSNDGTPASAKEQAYVLVNNYGWTITMN